MIGKPLLAFVAAPFLASASLPAEPIFVALPEVVKVSCMQGSGTAFRIGNGSYASVDHVTSLTDCSIDGEPITVTYIDKARDFSTLRTSVYGAGLKINCGGFVDGELYLAVGHAHGGPQRAIIVQASDEATRIASWNGFYTLVGDRFIPGMSGGAVFNRAGEVVGTVNGYNRVVPLSYSTPLSETALCR
jgi:hypothetical protein